jgi:hypothetical protein
MVDHLFMPGVDQSGDGVEVLRAQQSAGGLQRRGLNIEADYPTAGAELARKEQGIAAVADRGVDDKVVGPYLRREQSLCECGE